MPRFIARTASLVALPLAFHLLGCTSASPRATAAPATANVASARPASIQPSPPDASADVKVWANPNTMVYHCRGTGAFGLHPQGKVLTQGEAQKLDYRPAFGKTCPATPEAPQMALVAASTARAQGKSCGVERWPVKTLVDDDKAKIHATAVDAAVTDLVSIPRPNQQPPQSNRIAPTELTVFRVKALLTLVKKEKDQDYHLVLADPDDPETTMIAEVPSPTCAKGSNKEATFTGLRQTLDFLLGPHDDGIPVEIEGVGFFDFLHGQTGVAPNGIELHPVLAITILGNGVPQ